MVRGGSSSRGCNDMYEAMARARDEVRKAPRQALAVATRMKRFPKALVERAKQVRMIKGLKR